jgi:hypothetical protein
MNIIRNIAKKELLKESKQLNEVAGISFIVRRWAKILKREVEEQQDDHKKIELAKIKNKPKEETEDDFNNSRSYNGPSIDKSQMEMDFPEDDGTDIDKNDPFYWEDETSRGKGSQGTEWDDYDEWESRFRYDKQANWRNRDGGKDYYKKGGKNKGSESTGSYPGYGNSYGGRYSSGGYGGYGGYTPQPYIPPLNEVTVFGDSFPEEYKEFSVDMWVMKNSTRIEYDHYESGYAESGEYIVYLNVPLNNMSETAFVHEIKHAYDDWNRMRHGGKPIRDSWEIKNIYTKDFEKLILGGSNSFPQLGSIVRNFYYGSKLEAPAYLENEYDDTMIDYEDVGKKLMKFKASNYLDKRGNPARGVEEEFKRMQGYDIPLFKKFTSVVEFLYWTEKYFNKRGKDIFRRVSKMRHVHNLPKKVKYTGTYTPNSYTTGTYNSPKDEEDEEETLGHWRYSKEKGEWIEDDEVVPKKNTSTTTKTTGTPAEEKGYEEGESIGDWKYSKDRGWYLDVEDDEDEQDKWMR